MNHNHTPQRITLLATAIVPPQTPGLLRFNCGTIFPHDSDLPILRFEAVRTLAQNNALYLQTNGSAIQICGNFNIPMDMLRWIVANHPEATSDITVSYKSHYDDLASEYMVPLDLLLHKVDAPTLLPDTVWYFGSDGIFLKNSDVPNKDVVRNMTENQIIQSIMGDSSKFRERSPNKSILRP